jgi:hypothetical protein
MRLYLSVVVLMREEMDVVTEVYELCREVEGRHRPL